MSALAVSLAALIILFYSATATAGPAKDKELRLSLSDGIVRLLENNLDVSIERISPEVAAERVRSERGRFDIEAFTSFRRTDSTTPLPARSSVAAGGLTSIESETNSLSAGLTGITPFGTEYTFEVTDDWTADTLSGLEFEYTSFTGVTITQPLLKDFGRSANELSLRLARKDREISEMRFRQIVTERVAEYIRAYWELTRARGELRVRKESLGLAEALFERNRKKLAAGVTSRLEVTQSEAAVAARRDEVLIAGKAVRERDKELKLLISRDVYTLRDREIVPTDEPLVGDESFALEGSVAVALKKRPDYLETKSTLEKNNIRVKFTENQRFPTVDLEGSYGLAGLGDGFSGSFTGIDENPRWSVGVAVRYPLGNRTATGELRAAKLEADQQLLRLKKLEQQIIMEIDSAVKDIEADRKRVETARKATELAAESLSAEEKKLEAGRSTSYNVLQVEEDLTRARLNEVSSLVDYNLSVVRYFKEVGTLLEIYDIGFSEEL